MQCVLGLLSSPLLNKEGLTSSSVQNTVKMTLHWMININGGFDRLRMPPNNSTRYRYIGPSF